MKKILVVIFCVVLVIGLSFFVLTKIGFSGAQGVQISTRGLSEGEVRTDPRTQMSMTEASKTQTIALASGVENVLNAKILDLTALVQNPSIITAVQTQNATQAPSIAEITKLDDDWLASTSTTPLKKQLLTNATAQTLNAFEKAHPELTKIFIADSRGLVVGESVLTSDYYQADEPWWVHAMTTGKAFHGNTEFDQSTQTTAISLYVPILDPATQKPIGVLKAVVGMSYIQGQL